MRICFYNAAALTQRGGIETNIENLSRMLCKKGFEVSVVFGKGKIIHEKNKKAKYYSFPYIKRFTPLNNFLSKFSPNILTPFQIECISFWLSSWAHFLNHDYDVIIIDQLVDSIFLNLLKRFKKFKSVLFVHGYPTSLLKKPVKQIDEVICVSQKTKKHFEKILGIKASLVHNTVDTKIFRQKKQNKSIIKKFHLEKKFVLMTSSRLTDWKGIQYAIMAMPLVLEKNKNTALLIAGDGEYKKELKELTERLGVEKNVKFSGFLSRQELVEFFSVCGIFLSPNTGMEALSRSILEAMSCGKPIIATDIGGNPEQVENEKNGFLIEPKNEKVLAKKVIHLIKNAGERKRMGKNSRKIAEEKFSIEKNFEKVLEIIRH